MSSSSRHLSRIVLALIFWSLSFFSIQTGFAAEPTGRPRHLIKIASLAPEGSSWIKAVRTIDRKLRQQTNGEVGFKLYPGGVQGGESVVLRKIRVGQLHGAGLGGTGISDLFPDILALEMPFLFQDYDEVDYVLEQMDDFYQRGFEENGFVLLGWSDLGFVHILSKRPIRGVADINRRKVWRLEDEPITGVLFRKAGVTSIPLNIPDVLLGLQTNLIDVVYASPAAAIVLQWFTRVKYVTELPINYTLGALLVDSRTFSKLTPQHQDILRQLTKEHMRQQTLQTRQENQDAIQIMIDNGLEMVHPTSQDVETFEQLVEESVPELVGHAFSREAYEQVQSHLGDFRRQRAAAE